MMNRRIFYGRALKLAIIISLFGLCIHSNADGLTQEQIIRAKSMASFDTYFDIQGRFFLYYAQNNPVFLKTRVRKNYTVGGSSCAATALANVIINSVDFNDVTHIEDVAPKPIRIDTSSIQNSKGKSLKNKFVVTGKQDIAQFLPVSILNYVCGNNQSGFKQHMSMGYYGKVLNTYGLKYKKIKKVSECLEEMQKNNAMVLTCTGGKTSPIANKRGHYFVLAFADQEYVYCLDSYIKDEGYELDKKGIIEPLSPGLFRCKVQNLEDLVLTGTKYVVYPNYIRNRKISEKNKLIRYEINKIVLTIKSYDSMMIMSQ